MPDKVDKALAGQLKSGTVKNKVIITVQPGFRGSIRKALELKGNKIKREHAALNVFVAELDSATVLELAMNPLIKSVGLDGPMNSSQLLVATAGPAVTGPSSTVAPGTAFSVNVSGGPANRADWVTLAPSGTPDSTYLAWVYLSGTTSQPLLGLSAATLRFVAPATTGSYDVRFFANGGWTKLASTTVNVQLPIPTLTVPATVVPGAAFTVTATNGPGNRNDWVAMEAVSAPDTSYVAWKYLNGLTTVPDAGLTSGTMQFVAPPTPGTYNLRFFTNGWTKLATSASISVQYPTPNLTLSTLSVNPGAAFAVTATNGPGLRSDWVTITAVGAPDVNYVDWRYLNGSKSLPDAGRTYGTMPFVAPMTPGLYEMRFFANGWTKLATSLALSVQGSQIMTTTVRQTLGLPAVADSTTLTGSGGIGVAIIDSGISPSADFAGRITGFFDFTNGLNGVAVAPYDDYGHGTHVAGLIGSSGILSNYDAQGVAPSVNLIGLKVLDGTGSGLTSDVIAALQFVTANKDALNVKVVNMSLGHPIWASAANDPLVQAVQQATAAGLIVVVSAGNVGRSPEGLSGYAGVTSPCNAPSAICVGAAKTENTVSRGDDSVAPYSSRGPSWYDGFAKPDVIAPGNKLPSDTTLSSYLYAQLPTSRGQAKNGASLLALSGTSMAAGVASGVVALVIDAHNHAGLKGPALTANEVKAILQYSAISLPNVDHLTQGAGEINAAGAIALASSIDTSMPVDSWWLTQGVTPSSVIGGQSTAWAQNIVWGDAVYGGDVIYRNNIVWGDNVIWGSTTIAGANVIWGSGVTLNASNIVWGDNIIWGSNIVWGELAGQNAVWGTKVGSNQIVWGTVFGSNILWGETSNVIWDQTANIIWGQNVIWGSNIVWGENVVFGQSALTEEDLANSEAAVSTQAPPPPPVELAEPSPPLDTSGSGADADARFIPVAVLEGGSF